MFLRDNPLLEVAQAWHVYSDKKTFRIDFKMPQEVKERFVEYWRANLRKSHLHLYLENAAYLMISSEVSIEGTSNDISKITITFKPSTDPKIEVGIEEVTKLWPNSLPVDRMGEITVRD